MFNKSQSATEFVILVGFVIFLFTAFSLVIQEGISDKNVERKSLVVKEIAFAIKDEINLATKSIDGYYREFSIPENIYEEDYEVTIAENLVYVKTSNGKHAIALPIKEVIGSIGPGDNKIEKINGEVYVAQIS